MIIPHSANLLEYFKMSTYAPKHLFLKIDYIFDTCIRNILPLRHFEKSLINVVVFFNCLLFLSWKNYFPQIFSVLLLRWFPQRTLCLSWQVLVDPQTSVELFLVVSRYSRKHYFCTLINLLHSKQNKPHSERN